MHVPPLTTPRFFLQEIIPSDQAFIFKGLSDPDVIPFYGVSFDTFEATAAQIKFYSKIWEEKSGCWWKIVDRATNEPVGACGINYYDAENEKAEMGYWLLPAYWRQGIMQEVLPVMVEHVFATWALFRLEAVVEDGNEASGKLAQKIGFQFEGRLRGAEIKHGKHINLLMYSRLKTD